MKIELRELEELRKIHFNNSFNPQAKKQMNIIERAVLNEIKSLKRSSTIGMKIKNLVSGEDYVQIPPSFNILIYDFEGDSPVKLLGILFRNKIFQIYLKCLDDPFPFYEAIMRIFRIIKNCCLFGFTFHDFDMLFKIREEIKEACQEKRPDLEFITSLNYFNLQKRDKESLAEALYSLNLSFPKDPLFRNTILLDRLYEENFVEIIQLHNLSCLKAESLLLMNRYLRENLIWPLETIQRFMSHSTFSKRNHVNSQIIQER